MGIRSAVFDEWLKEKMAAWKDAVVIHMGCGMDSRVLRVGTREHLWYDVDFPEVIKERKRYYEESSYYHMIASDVRQKEWQEVIAKKKEAIIIMEGISMYMDNEALQNLLQDVSGHFEQATILMDCYTTMAAKMSKYKNPINDVGVSTVYGLDDPLQLQKEKVVFIKEHNMTPQSYIEQLRGVDSGYSVSALLTKKLIEECGRLNVPGRPILYRTTADFLRTFGLQSLEDLHEIELMNFKSRPQPSSEDGGEVSL